MPPGAAADLPTPGARRPRSRLVLGGLILHPIAQAREAMQFYRAFTRSAPDELTIQ